MSRTDDVVSGHTLWQTPTLTALVDRRMSFSAKELRYWEMTNRKVTTRNRSWEWLNRRYSSLVYCGVDVCVSAWRLWESVIVMPPHSWPPAAWRSLTNRLAVTQQSLCVLSSPQPQLGHSVTVWFLKANSRHLVSRVLNDRLYTLFWSTFLDSIVAN